MQLPSYTVGRFFSLVILFCVLVGTVLAEEGSTASREEAEKLSWQERWTQMLDWKVTRFEVENLPVMDALEKLQRVVDEEHGRSFTISARDPQMYQDRQISLKLAHARLKDVLRVLGAQAGITLECSSLGLMISPRKEKREE